MSSALSPIYGRLPVAFTHGEGVWLWDETGKRYLDGLSGIGVSCLGHAHPALVNAISEQAHPDFCQLVRFARLEQID